MKQIIPPPTQGQQRLLWIDYMKAIGMYLIVLGHFFPIGHKFIYVFSVPLFFIISGFLSKRESNQKEFWKKLWYNLALTMIIITLLAYSVRSVGDIVLGRYNIGELIKLPINLLLGMWNILKECWFIYTLILIKIVFQYTRGYITDIVITILSLLISWIIYREEFVIFGYNILHNPTSLINLFCCYPFFIIGFYIAKYKRELVSYKITPITIIYFIISLACVIVCYLYNDDVRMYTSYFGDNIFLYLLGGVSGAAMIFFICKLLEGYNLGWLKTISVGSIIILGFHIFFIQVLRKIFTEPSLLDYVWSLLIIFIFVPIITFIQKYLPLLIGKYRTK